MCPGSGAGATAGVRPDAGIDGKAWTLVTGRSFGAAPCRSCLAYQGMGSALLGTSINFCMRMPAASPARAAAATSAG